MSENLDLPGAGALSTSILGGMLSVQDEVGLPFQREVMKALADLGIVNESTNVVKAAYPDIPPFPPNQPPMATFGLETLVIGFGLYLAAKVSDKTVDELLSAIYEDRIEPALRRLGVQLRSRGSLTGDVVLTRFDHWFDGSKVLVRIRIYTRSPQTADSEVVAQVLRSAVSWVAHHPVTHRVLTYEVREGKVPAEPTLSEPV